VKTVNVKMSDLKYKEITEKIICCAMRVHAALGNGFQEMIWQRAMEIEFRLSGLSFSRAHSMKVYFQNKKYRTPGLPINL
jgi:GxxExxY protein